MELHVAFFVPSRELCSRMQVCVSICLLPQMTSPLWLLILSGLAVASLLGLEDVFFSPQDLTVREGEAVFFQCVSGESSPLASITWLKDGKLVTRGNQFQGEYGGGQKKKTSGTLHLLNVTLEDNGIYICVTHNYFLNISKKSKPAKLTVQGVPRRLQIIRDPDNITIAMGTEVSMQCTVYGFPVPMVHWFKDSCLLLNCSTSFSLQNNGQLLTFRNVTREDEGWYHCEASNEKETIKSQPAFLLPAEMDWSFVQQPTNLTVKRGENVTLTCRPPHSRPEAQVSWFRNNQLLAPTAQATVLPSGDLVFHSILENNSGSYFCRASNIHLQRFLTSKRATLTVLAPPSVKVWPQVLTVPLGARAVLECEVSGHPLPSISWMKRGHFKQTGGKVAYGQRNASLHIQSARSYDEAVYVCEASNTLGKTHSTALLRVAGKTHSNLIAMKMVYNPLFAFFPLSQVSPIIVTYVGHVSCKIGASVVLPCGAVGIQPIRYSWTKGRAETPSPISPTEDKHVDEGGALHIPSVQYSDAGEYFCTAENRAGRHQRHTVLTITAEDHPADRDTQTSKVLSASTNVGKALLVSLSADSMAVRNFKTTIPPDVQAQHKETIRSIFSNSTTSPTFSRTATAELKMPSRSLHFLPHHLNQQTTNPTQPLITQMQPPILPPPPHPNFQSVDDHTKLLLIRDPLLISNSQPPATRSPTSVITREVLGLNLQYELTESQTLTSPSAQFQHQVAKESFPEPDSLRSNSNAESLESEITEKTESQPSSKLRVGGPFGFLKFDSYPPTPTQSPVITTKMRHSDWFPLTVTSQAESYLVTNTPFSHHDQSLIPQVKQIHLQPSSTLHQASQTPPHKSFTLNFLPKFQLELSTFRPSLLPPSSVTKAQPSQFHGQPSKPGSLQYPQLSSTIVSLQDSGSSVLDSEVIRPVNRSDQLNATQTEKPLNNTKLTDWLKRNTSQSPMTSNDPKLTQQSPSWLPMLEKHDIPIVVGVGASLAFIFITVAFYSVVQKNETVPTSRAVIEQSPNTSDTRARPPGPSLVTVQLEPTFEELRQLTQPTLDNHSVTVETYPEPIVDTKIDPSFEEERGCSSSQPSVQLQCTEDWTSNRGDNHSPCPDTLPPPSSLPSPSPSPTPASRREETLHSSVTLQTTEPLVAPIHHSLNISHGNPPLLLTHHLSLGLTTVAVDVQFYPAATASMAVGTSTHINSVSNSTSVTAPLFSPPLANSQENDDRSTARFHHSK
ncbi:uncharacterized protein PAE49_006192 isoform 3-T3 [Odontesthes bonariensis]|uniref:uncharacterized protein LOC142382024 isoform X3 n=1 Tax=Odontesthes bonariensis TaxID=219752 RepID=UPI003F58E164